MFGRGQEMRTSVREQDEMQLVGKHPLPTCPLQPLLPSQPANQPAIKHRPTWAEALAAARAWGTACCGVTGRPALPQMITTLGLTLHCSGEGVGREAEGGWFLGAGEGGWFMGAEKAVGVRL